MSFAKSVFPIPPPTTNDLTVTQRSQLRKSTRKIGKILGITPRLVENTSKAITLSLPLSPSAYEHGVRFGSSDDSLPSPVSSTPSSATSTQGFFRTPTFNSTTSSLTSISDQEEGPVPPKDLWPTLNQPSLFISTQSAKAAGVKEPSHLTKSRHSRSLSLDGFRKDSSAQSNTPFVLVAPSTTQTQDSLSYSPSFQVTTNSTLRRQKMEKLRRTLGDNVPLELVFPQSSPLDDVIESEEPTCVPSDHMGHASTSPPHHRIRRVPAPKWDSNTEGAISSKRLKALSVILEGPDF